MLLGSYQCINSELQSQPSLPCFAVWSWSLSLFLFGSWHDAGSMARGQDSLCVTPNRNFCAHQAQRKLSCSLVLPHSLWTGPAKAASHLLHQLWVTATPLPARSKSSLGEGTRLHTCSFLWGSLLAFGFLQSSLLFLPSLADRKPPAGMLEK